MKIGFTIGKFAPLHIGHEYLIERGLSECNEFYILINNTDVIDVPIEVRANWLKQCYPKAHIILGKNPPKQYGMDDESIKIQIEYLKGIFKNIAVTDFYSCEDYGKFVADGMNVNNNKLDKIISISGTKIRENLKSYQQYMNYKIYKEYLLY